MNVIIIYNIISISIISLAIFLSMSLLIRMSVDMREDKKLNVDTRGLRSWGRGSLYNRTESTPYLALKSLVDKYKFPKNTQLVDFGCGKGRVAIYLHDTLKIPVTGVEVMSETYKDAIINVNEYGNHEQIEMKNVFAEEYEIKRGDNIFFFFNPFHHSVFKKVVENIKDDSVRNNKQVIVILYYPLNSFVKILNELDFELNQTVLTKGSMSLREKFLIYKMN